MRVILRRKKEYQMTWSDAASLLAPGASPSREWDAAMQVAAGMVLSLVRTDSQGLVDWLTVVGVRPGEQPEQVAARWDGTMTPEVSMA
jgi:hypothetical protein